MPDEPLPWSDWTPTLAAVGAFLRARTVDKDGNELGTFTANTRPTAAQVTDLLEQACPDVYGEVGAVPEVLWPQARKVAALGTALLVELSYFPEQISANRSPYDTIKTLYDEGLKRLAGGVGELASGDQLGSGDDPAMPVFGFGSGREDVAPGAEWPWDGPCRQRPPDRPVGFGTNW